MRLAFLGRPMEMAAQCLTAIGPLDPTTFDKYLLEVGLDLGVVEIGNHQGAIPSQDILVHLLECARGNHLQAEQIALGLVGVGDDEVEGEMDQPGLLGLPLIQGLVDIG